MLRQLVLADLQKQIAQEVRNAYIKSSALKKPFWKHGFFLFHPLTPSHLHRKKHIRPKQKQPEKELKCHNMNLRASEVASLPFPVFGLMSIPSELVLHKRKDKRWQQLISLKKNISFSTEQHLQKGYTRGPFQRKPWNTLQPCATILRDATAARHLDKLGVAQFPFLEASWAVNSYTDTDP